MTATTNDALSPVSRRHAATTSRRIGPGLDRALRVLVAIALLGAVAWLVLNAGLFRMFEATLTASWLNPFIAGGVAAHGDTFAIWLDEHHIVGFQVTAECTAVILIVPLLALGAGLMLSKRVSWMRGLAGIATMLTVIMVVNQIRLGLIGWSTFTWGVDAGYEFSHRFAGSAIGIFGFAAGLVLMLVVMGLRRRRPATNPS